MACRFTDSRRRLFDSEAIDCTRGMNPRQCPRGVPEKVNSDESDVCGDIRLFLSKSEKKRREQKREVDVEGEVD